jgi:hypothetical protein
MNSMDGLKNYIEKDQIPTDLGGTAVCNIEAWIAQRFVAEGIDPKAPVSRHKFSDEIIAMFSSMVRLILIFHYSNILSFEIITNNILTIFFFLNKPTSILYL